MESESTNPLVVIVGETGSGKSALAIELAERFKGEIICADSRTVYKGLDIGTAKPSLQDRERVPHHLLDVVEPDQSFTAADFKRLAKEAVDRIHARAKLPIMVGGSGLYIDAVLYDFGFSADSAKRNLKNPRHLAFDQPRPHQSLRPETLIIGLQPSRGTLEKRITARTNQMLQDGLADEVRRSGERFGWDCKALQAPAYRAFSKFVIGKTSLEEAKNDFIRRDLRLAKRQRTWFKRNSSIHWLSDPSEATSLVAGFLNKKPR